MPQAVAFILHPVLLFEELHTEKNFMIGKAFAVLVCLLVSLACGLGVGLFSQEWWDGCSQLACAYGTALQSILVGVVVAIIVFVVLVRGCLRSGKSE